MAAAPQLTDEQADAKYALLEAFGQLMQAYGVAEEAGLQPAPILANALKVALEEQGQTLPPMLAMLF